MSPSTSSPSWAHLLLHAHIFPFMGTSSGPIKRPSGQDLAQNCHFPFKFCNFSFSKICLLRLHFLSFWPFGPSFLFIFWPFGPSFPFILAFWAFISFHFGLLGLDFLSFWSFGFSFPFILAFWDLISLILAFSTFQKSHLARIWPKIAISPLNFAIFPFPKFAF